jgi:hypothetical protein
MTTKTSSRNLSSAIAFLIRARSGRMAGGPVWSRDWS